MSTIPGNINPDLLISFLNGETDDSETILVKEWIELSAGNRAEFEALQKIWDESENAFPEQSNVDVEKAWLTLSQRIIDEAIEKGNRPVQSLKRPYYFRFGLRVAAVLIPLLAITFILVHQRNKQRTIEFASVSDTTSILLSDGTRVQMNQKSVLTYPQEFRHNSRDVSLRGEAFFTVAPNREIPFFIHLNKIDLKVVGTSFNVKAVPTENIISVIVKTGTVVLYSLNSEGEKMDSVFLEAGQKGAFSKTLSHFTGITILDENDLFWVTKTLLFTKTRLDSVFPLIERTYGIKVVIKDKQINDLRLTARFDGQTADKIMEIIGESFGLRLTTSGSTYEVDGSKK